MKAKKRAVPVWMIVTEAVLVVLFLFLTIWWFGLSYPAFDRLATRGADLPGLGTGISPQGICALPDGCGYDYAMSGYLSGKPSRVYLIAEDKETELFVTFTKEGKPIETHFGGVTASENYLYIASESEIVRAAIRDVVNAENGSAVEITDSFRTGLGNAFCYLEKDRLYAGEFYRPGNYETDPSHHLEVGDSVNHAFVYEFALDEQKTGGVADTVPTKVLSVCDQVQGIAVTNDVILLSCSYGLPDSSLRVYDNKLGEQADGTVTVGGKQVPLYLLGKEKGSLRMPCMSEELFIKDGTVTVLFESMSLKYRFVVHSRISQLIRIPLGELKSSVAGGTK